MFGVVLTLTFLIEFALGLVATESQRLMIYYTCVGGCATSILRQWDIVLLLQVTDPTRWIQSQSSYIQLL